MKILVVILIFLSFLQTTILPLDLVLVVLFLQSYIRPERKNLILAFAFGILISHLTNQFVGLYALIYLSLVELTQVLAKVPIHKNLFFGGLVLVPFLILEKLVLSKILIATANFWMVGLEILLAVPIYFLLKLWEERFVVKSEIKLRV